jgi:hypothetical protein
VLQVCDGPRFELKALFGIFIQTGVGRQDLNRNRTVNVCPVAKVHRGHPAMTDHIADFILAEISAYQ